MDSRLRGYGIAVASVVIAWGIREALVPLWGRTHFPFVVFQLAVAVAAWLGRVGPGMLATALSACTVLFFFRGSIHRFSIDDPADVVALLMFAAISLCVVLAIETMHRAQEASRQSGQKLAAELHATQRLQEISNDLVQIDDTKVLYEKILDTAVVIMSSHFASMQTFYPERGTGGELHLIAHRGFTQEAAKAWEWVGSTSCTSCGEAFRLGRRVIVSDLPAKKLVGANDEVENYLQHGIRAVQSTPLYSRSGALLGMLSTHWREAHEPEINELRLLDVLARLAADLFDRIRTEEALRDADRRKDEFLALLGHELRNPLGIISIVVQMLRIDGPPDPRLQEYLTTLELQVKQMTRLLEDLLDISRITRGVIRLKKEPCDLAMIVRQAVQSHRPLAEEAGLYVETRLPDEAFCVTGDQARLTQIVGNLLYNAIKYTGRDGRITVQLTSEPWGEAALLTIRDTGIGIEQDMLHRIFEPFVQAEAGFERSRGGLGIGLALVKGLVTLHDGEVLVSSAGPGRGSEFTIRLPLTTIVLSSESKKPIVDDARPRRILIIEDNRPAAQSLRALLLKLGHTVETAFNGTDGLAIAHRFMPEIVLCDISLPGLDGHSLAQAMRQSPQLRGAYLVAVTGYGREGDKHRAFEAGFDRYLTKPIEPTELERFVSGSASRAQQENA